MFDSPEYQYLKQDLQQYMLTQWELLKINFLEKVARIVGLILFGLVVILIGFAILTFGGLALIAALSTCLPVWASILIVIGIWVLLLAIAIIFRKQLFINPVIAAVSAILFGRHEVVLPSGKEERHA